MSDTDRIFRATRRHGYSTQWQSERARGPILPMETPSLFQRMREWARRLGEATIVSQNFELIGETHAIRVSIVIA